MKFIFNFSLFVIKHFQFINRECRKLFVEADVSIHASSEIWNHMETNSGKIVARVKPFD